MTLETSTTGTGDGNGAENAGKDKPVQLTQAALDTMFAERADSARRAALAKLFADLGVADAEALKATIAASKAAQDAEAERQRAALSESERLKADLATANQKAADAEAARVAAIAQAQQILVRSTIERLAVEAGFESADDAWLQVDQSKITVEDGKVKGAKEEIARIAAAKPYLLKTTKVPQTPGAGQRRKNGDGTTGEKGSAIRVAL